VKLSDGRARGAAARCGLGLAAAVVACGTSQSAPGVDGEGGADVSSPLVDGGADGPIDATVGDATGVDAAPADAAASDATMDAGPSDAGLDDANAEGGAPDAASTDAGASSEGGEVLTFHKHMNRDGFYVDPAFTTAALSAGTIHIDSTFDGTGIHGEVRASPLYAEKGYGGAPTFYVADESDNVYAFEAGGGGLLKTVSLGTGATTEPCGNVHDVGIRGTPAIDPVTGIMVLDAATGTAGAVSGHTIFGLRTSDLSTAWSLDVSTLSDPVAGPFLAAYQNQRSAVLIVGSTAYVTYGGFGGDCGTYHGWVVGVPVANGAGARTWATPATYSGIWAPGGASSDGQNIFVATGNGPLVGTAWGGAFSVVRLQAGPTFSGAASDYWVAINDTSDDDLGGSGPLVVNPPGAMPYIVQLGKDGTEYLIDTSKPLGGFTSPTLGAARVMNDNIVCGPAWARIAGTTYVAMVGNSVGSGGAACPAGTSGELVVTTVDPADASSPIATAWCANPQGAASPIVTSSDGSADALVWVAGALVTNDKVGNDNQMHAFDLVTGAVVVGGSDPFASVHHFTSPIVVHGRLFVAGDTRLYAYRP
jgi:hypothetical protein